MPFGVHFGAPLGHPILTSFGSSFWSSFFDLILELLLELIFWTPFSTTFYAKRLKWGSENEVLFGTHFWSDIRQNSPAVFGTPKVT